MMTTLEHRIASLLRIGMTAAAVVVCAGAAWFLLSHGSDPADYRAFHPRPARLGALHDGRALMQLGLLILVVTPIARVAFTVSAFARNRDRAYAVITASVLCILLYSLLGGH